MLIRSVCEFGGSNRLGSCATAVRVRTLWGTWPSSIDFPVSDFFPTHICHAWASGPKIYKLILTINDAALKSVVITNRLGSVTLI